MLQAKFGAHHPAGESWEGIEPDSAGVDGYHRPGNAYSDTNI